MAQEAEPDNQLNQVEAIKFIKENKDKGFDDNKCKKLFSFYTLDEKAEKLQAQDVRKLALDILAAYEFPLVVPDEILNKVLEALGLDVKSENSFISYVEFKSFCVYLKDEPINSIFQIMTNKSENKIINLKIDEIKCSRLVTIKPIRHKQNKDDNHEDQAGGSDNKVDNYGDNDVQQEQSDEKKEQSYYDRNKWETAVKSLLPKETQTQNEYKIFIYFMDGYQILALAISKEFKEPLIEPAAAELKLDDMSYLATIRAFDINNDMFPPIARSGGMKSKVARKIADSYIVARSWDEKHLKIVEKTGNLAHTVSVKWTEFDEKYKVNERVNATTTSILNSVKAFDEKHQLTRRLSSGAKQFNEKFGITDKLGSVADKISSNEKVQIVSNKVNESFKAAVKTIDDIGQETQQLVQEKRQQNLPDEPQEQQPQQQQQQQPQQAANDNSNVEGGAPDEAN